MMLPDDELPQFACCDCLEDVIHLNNISQHAKGILGYLIRQANAFVMVNAREKEDCSENTSSCSDLDSECKGQLERSTYMHWNSLRLLNVGTGVKRYRFQGCRRLFLSQNKLKLPSENCQKFNLHRCKDCGKILPNLDELNRHNYLFHSLDECHPCGKCLKRFRSRKKLVKHIKKYDFQCKPKKLRDLMDDNPENNAVSLSDEITNGEINKAGGEGIESNCYVQECNQTLNPDSKTGVSSDNYYTCDACAYVCKYKRELVLHIKESHRSAKPYVCTVCCSGFTSSVKLYVHQQLHKKQFTCKDCGKGFLVKICFRQHVKVCQKIITYKCHICSREYCTKGHLKNHLFCHFAKKFSCTQCPKTYSYQCSLTSHIRICHLKLRPHECGVCRKRFAIRRNLAWHLCTHSDDRPFKCAFCEKLFKLKKRVRRHEKSMHFREEHVLS